GRRNRPARLPGDSREARARRLDHVSDQVPSRDRVAGAEAARRGRAAAAARLRGHEEAPGADAAPRQRPPSPLPAAAGAGLRLAGEKGRGSEVASGRALPRQEGGTTDGPVSAAGETSGRPRLIWREGEAPAEPGARLGRSLALPSLRLWPTTSPKRQRAQQL